jgi:hypothetical protein
MSGSIKVNKDSKQVTRHTDTSTNHPDVDARIARVVFSRRCQCKPSDYSFLLQFRPKAHKCFLTI